MIAARNLFEQWTAPERLAWLAPPAIFVVVLRSPFPIAQLVAVALGLGLIVVLARRPMIPLIGLVIGLPLSQLVLAALYRIGTPRALVRPLGQWKEAAVAAIVLAALVRWRRDRPPLDVLDKLALGYVAIGIVYLVLPGLFVAGSSKLTLTDRFFGFRTDVVYVLLLLAGRHLRLDRRQLRALLSAALGTMVLVGAVGVFEWLSSDSWNRFVIETLRLPRYRIDVLGLDPVLEGRKLYDIRTYGEIGGRRFVRVGSTLFSQLSAAFYLAAGVALAVELLVRGRARRGMAVGCGLMVGGLVFTQTRAGLLAATVAVLLAVRPMRGRSRVNRIRFTLALAGMAVFALPAIIGAGLSDRLSGDEESDSLHRQSLTGGISALVDSPLGRGLSTAAGGGQRVGSADVIVTENQFLQIGVQLGVPAMLLYLGLVLILPRYLLRPGGRTDDGDGDVDDDAAASAVRTMFIGLCVGGMFLQPFIEFSVSWTVWALVGACIGRLDAARRSAKAASSSAGSEDQACER